MQPLRIFFFLNPNTISMQFHSYEQSLTSYLNQANRWHVYALYSLRVCQRMFRPAMAGRNIQHLHQQ